MLKAPGNLFSIFQLPTSGSMSKLSAPDLTQQQHRRTDHFKRSAQADCGSARDGYFVCRYCLAAVHAVPLDRIGAGLYRQGERLRRFARLEDKVLLAGT